MFGQIGCHIDRLDEPIIEIVNILIFCQFEILVFQLLFDLVSVVFLYITIEEWRAKFDDPIGFVTIFDLLLDVEILSPTLVEYFKLVYIDIDPRNNKNSSIIQKILP